MTPNNFIVTVIQGPTFIMDSLAEALELAMDLIAMGYAPDVKVYSTIRGK